MAYQVFCRLSLVMLLLLAVGYTAGAQEHCGTDKAVALQMAQHPGLAERIAAIREATLQEAAAISASKQPLQVTIPVIVHVIHNGEPLGTGANITDAQVLSQLEVLNEDYRRLNADATNTPGGFAGVAADVEIEFCLAIRAEDGSFTTGIEHIDGNLAVWEINDIDGILKPATVWNRNKYLNIWTCNIGGTDLGTLGYASPPGLPASTDGVVVSYQYFGRGGSAQSPYNQGRTATHEVGHWLGLIHTWGPSDPATASCADDDGVADTPVQSRANYGCPTFPKVSCSNGPNGDMFMNYMDYTNDACMNLFTQGQKSLMLTTLSTIRSGIGQSDACLQFAYDMALEDVLHPRDTTCTAAVRPLILVRNEGTEVVTSLLVNYILDLAFNQFSWTGSIAPGEEAFITLPTLTLSAGDHEVEVFVASPNGQVDENQGNDTKTVNFFVMNGTPVNFGLPFSEDFEGVFPDFGWEVYDVDNDGSWAKDATAGGFSNSANSISVDVSGVGPGNIDEFSTPIFVLSGDEEFPALTFDYAFAPTTANSSDRLDVYASLDCGNSWELIWSEVGTDLATAPSTAGAFVPTQAQWANELILVEPLAGQSNFQFKFSLVNDVGNKMYIDNINITNQTVGINTRANFSDFTLYPNPTRNMVTVKAPATAGAYTINVYDMAGRLLVQQQAAVDGGSLDMLVDVSALPSGLAIVQLKDATGASAYKKLIIQ